MDDERARKPGGFEAGLAAGRRGIDKPLAVRRRSSPTANQGPRRSRPPILAFGVMAISVLLVVNAGAIDRLLHTSGPFPVSLGVALSAVGVMMLRRPGRR